MRELEQVNNQELVQELGERIRKNQLTAKEIRALQEEINEILEEEVWQKDYELAAQDKERTREANEWENLENKIDNG